MYIFKFLTICRSPLLSLVENSLKILSDILTKGNNVQSRQVLKFGVLSQFFILLEHEKSQVLKWACKAIKGLVKSEDFVLTLINDEISLEIFMNFLKSTKIAVILLKINFF